MYFLFDRNYREVDWVVTLHVCQTALTESLSCQDPPTEGSRYYLYISWPKERLCAVDPPSNQPKVDCVNIQQLQIILKSCFGFRCVVVLQGLTV